MPELKKWLSVVGVGSGSEAYLTPAAREAAEKAEVLVGGTRALNLFKYLQVEKFTLTGDLESLVTFLRKIHGKPTVVLVSGDPGFYSLLPWLKKQFPSENICVIPGISSMQMALAHLAATWEQADFLSLHGREMTLLEPFLHSLREGEAKLVLLTGGVNSPQAVGRYLAEHGLGEYPVWIGTALGSPLERCLWLKAAELACQDLPEAVVVLGYD